MPLPLCFVLMPLGKKRPPAGGADIDFDAIYEQAIRPTLVDSGFEPIRADHEVEAGVIDRSMFEKLLLCDVAVVDLTTAGADVFYELGIRHAGRPQSTLTIFAEGQPIPFDVGMLRAIRYGVGRHGAFGAEQASALAGALAERLRSVRERAGEPGAGDSPLVQLLQGYRCPELAHLRTDVFRDRVAYAESMRGRLRQARQQPAAQGAAALAAIEREMGTLDGVEAGVLVDLLLSYRAVGDFDAMISLYARLPEVLRRTVMVREQLAFALNRKAAGLPPDEREARREQAVHLLEDIIQDLGPNPETCGLLGRIFKDRWDEARTTSPDAAAAFLRRAIAEYVRGFEADWRDAYPGVNAVTLLELEGSPASLRQRDRLLPVVRFAVERKLDGSDADYWDHATLLELAVLGNDREQARAHLGRAVAAAREYWEPETTARSLRLLLEQRQARGEQTDWLNDLLDSLEEAVRQRRGT